MNPLYFFHVVRKVSILPVCHAFEIRYFSFAGIGDYQIQILMLYLIQAIVICNNET